MNGFKTALTRAVLLFAQRPRLQAFMHSSIVPLLQVAGTRACMQLMTFLVMIVLARKLGPASFGIYAFAVLVGTSLSELLLGMGADMAAIRLSAPHWQNETERAWLVFQAVGLVKVVLSLGLTLLLVLSADFVGGVLLHRPEFVVALRAAAAALLAITLTEFALSVFQARQRFKSFAVFGVGVSLIRTVPLLALVFIYPLTISAVLAVYVGSLFLGCALALAPSHRFLISARGSYRDLLRELLGYAGWMSLTVFFATVGNSLDTLALAYFKGAQEVGVYATARMFSTVITVLTMASLAILLPKYGRMTSIQARRQAIQRAAGPLAGFALVAAVALNFAASPLVSFFCGPAYLDAVPVLRVLAWAYGLELGTTTLAVFLLVENRPDVLAKAAMIGAITAVVGYVLLVPSLGAFGAALVSLGYRLVGTAVCLVWLPSVFFSHSKGRGLTSQE